MTTMKRKIKVNNYKKFKDFKSAVEYISTRSAKEILTTKIDPTVKEFLDTFYKLPENENNNEK